MRAGVGGGGGGGGWYQLSRGLARSWAVRLDRAASSSILFSIGTWRRRERVEDVKTGGLSPPYESRRERRPRPQSKSLTPSGNCPSEEQSPGSGKTEAPNGRPSGVMTNSVSKRGAWPLRREVHRLHYVRTYVLRRNTSQGPLLHARADRVTNNATEIAVVLGARVASLPTHPRVDLVRGRTNLCHATIVPRRALG